jgi:hypothetical protein
MYKISAYTKDRAKKIGVNVRPSKTAGKKIDVYLEQGQKEFRINSGMTKKLNINYNNFSCKVKSNIIYSR